MQRSVFYFFITLLWFVSCKVDDEIIPAAEPDITFVQPQNFPPPVYTFQNNPLTTKGFELGRKLFYDPLLSIDSSTSCGSCHQQFAAFAHYDHTLSHGIYNLLGKRNAPPLFNLAWQKDFMWDGGINHIEIQPFAPITNPVEMGETLSHVVSKLQSHPIYPGLFNDVFGSDSITSQNMFRALAQFMAMLNSYQSKYDNYIAGIENFSAVEEEGLQLFRQKNCNACHAEPLFTDLSFRNNGLDSVFADSGRAAITFLASDMGKFKVPSLRNVALSKPYMHNGRFDTLDKCLEHYNNGIKQSATLDTLLVNGITLSAEEKNKIIAFLNTLTDTRFTKDKRFSEN